MCAGSYLFRSLLSSAVGRCFQSLYSFKFMGISLGTFLLIKIGSEELRFCTFPNYWWALGFRVLLVVHKKPP